MFTYCLLIKLLSLCQLLTMTDWVPFCVFWCQLTAITTAHVWMQLPHVKDGHVWNSRTHHLPSLTNVLFAGWSLSALASTHASITIVYSLLIVSALVVGFRLTTLLILTAYEWLIVSLPMRQQLSISLVLGSAGKFLVDWHCHCSCNHRTNHMSWPPS